MKAVRWGADFIMAAHFDDGCFVAQIGDPAVDDQGILLPATLKFPLPHV